MGGQAWMIAQQSRGDHQADRDGRPAMRRVIPWCPIDERNHGSGRSSEHVVDDELHGKLAEERKGNGSKAENDKRQQEKAARLRDTEQPGNNRGAPTGAVEHG